mgnify:CR=1 FL=1
MTFPRTSISLLTMAFLLALSLNVVAQSYKFLPKKSHRLTSQEMEGRRISPTLPTYLEDGTSLGSILRMKYMTSPNYRMDLYGDKSGEPVAFVAIEVSEEEAEQRLASMMMRDNTGSWKNKSAPIFAKLDMENLGFNLSETRGKIVVLNFWFIGCMPCLIEIPELNEVVEKYKDQDVVFVALALDEKEQLIPFLQRTPFDYSVIPSARGIAQRYNIEGYPTHLLIDREGKVQYYNKGYNGAVVSILDKKIEGLLK